MSTDLRASLGRHRPSEQARLLDAVSCSHCLWSSSRLYIRSMRTLKVHRFVAAEPATVWELLSTTSSWSEWGPSVSDVEPADAELSLGMRGRVRTPYGLWLPFRITHYDAPHSWAWSVLGIPATRHIVGEAPGGCCVSFEVPAPAVTYLIVCLVALKRIAALAEGADGPVPPLV